MVVIYWRSVPVVVLPEHTMWPLGGVVRFPTQTAGVSPFHSTPPVVNNVCVCVYTGGVGSPIWALCSRQGLRALATLLSKK